MTQESIRKVAEKLGRIRVYPFGRRSGDLAQPRRRRTRLTAAWIAIIVEILIIMPGTYLYLTSRDERRKERQYQAWQVISAADGRKWGGGRASALQDLNREGVELRAVNLSGAFLTGLILPNADLKHSQLDSVNFNGADLHGARMARTSLRHANLGVSNLRDAEFVFARADGASFVGARLCGAVFIGASLRGALFHDANLQDVRFDGADLRGAVFPMNDVPLGASFREANIDGIQASETFIQQAFRTGAVTQSDAFWSLYRGTHDLDWRIRWVQQDTARGQRGADRRRNCADLRHPTQ